MASSRLKSAGEIIMKAILRWFAYIFIGFWAILLLIMTPLFLINPPPVSEGQNQIVATIFVATMMGALAALCLVSIWLIHASHKHNWQLFKSSKPLVQPQPEPVVQRAPVAEQPVKRPISASEAPLAQETNSDATKWGPDATKGLVVTLVAIVIIWFVWGAITFTPESHAAQLCKARIQQTTSGSVSFGRYGVSDVGGHRYSVTWEVHGQNVFGASVVQRRQCLVRYERQPNFFGTGPFTIV